jgi:hypothetical protein
VSSACYLAVLIGNFCLKAMCLCANGYRAWQESSRNCLSEFMTELHVETVFSMYKS